MTQTSPVSATLREVIAGIVDPGARFQDLDGVTWSRFDLERREMAYRKADSILALTAGHAQTPQRLAIETAVQKVLATDKWPINRDYDDAGLSERQYVSFAAEVLSALSDTSTVCESEKGSPVGWGNHLPGRIEP